MKRVVDPCLWRAKELGVEEVVKEVMGRGQTPKFGEKGKFTLGRWPKGRQLASLGILSEKGIITRAQGMQAPSPSHPTWIDHPHGL